MTPPKREVRHRNPNQRARAHAAACAIDVPITSDPQWRAVAVSRRGNRLDEVWALKHGRVWDGTLFRCLAVHARANVAMLIALRPAHEHGRRGHDESCGD